MTFALSNNAVAFAPDSTDDRGVVDGADADQVGAAVGGTAAIRCLSTWA